MDCLKVVVGSSVILPCLSWICQWLGEKGIADENQYTINHVQYNQQFLHTLFNLIILSLYLMITQKNCGILLHSRKLEIILKTIFLLTRIIALFYGVTFILKDIAKTYSSTVSLFIDNNWKSKDENFLTNQSYFNAAVCWILSTFLIIINLTFLLLLMTRFKRTIYGICVSFVTLGGLIEGLCLEQPPERYLVIFYYLEEHLLN